MIFHQKVKFTIPRIDNKTNIGNINNELEKKIFPLLSNKQKSIMTSDIMQKISLYNLDAESWLSKKKTE